MVFVEPKAFKLSKSDTAILSSTTWKSLQHISQKKRFSSWLLSRSIQTKRSITGQLMDQLVSCRINPPTKFIPRWSACGNISNENHRNFASATSWLVDEFHAQQIAVLVLTSSTCREFSKSRARLNGKKFLTARSLVSHEKSIEWICCYLKNNILSGRCSW